MRNDLSERIEAAILEPFEGDRWDRVACFAAGQAVRRAIFRVDEPPALEAERFRADTTGAVVGYGVFPATWTYARRRSIAFQVATVLPMDRPKMVAASLTPTGLPIVRYPAEGVTATKSDATWEATPVEVQAVTAVTWSVVSGELVEDMSGPLSGDGIAQLGRV